MGTRLPDTTKYAIPHTGDHVQHPLYPELGTGTVIDESQATQPSCRTGRVRWADGRTTRPCLGILRIVETP